MEWDDKFPTPRKDPMDAYKSFMVKKSVFVDPNGSGPVTNEEPEQEV